MCRHRHRRCPILVLLIVGYKFSSKSCFHHGCIICHLKKTTYRRTKGCVYSSRRPEESLDTGNRKLCFAVFFSWLDIGRSKINANFLRQIWKPQLEGRDLVIDDVGQVFMSWLMKRSIEFRPNTQPRSDFHSQLFHPPTRSVSALLYTREKVVLWHVLIWKCSWLYYMLVHEVL